MSGASRFSSRLTSGTTAGPSAAGVRSMHRSFRAASSDACSTCACADVASNARSTAGCSSRRAPVPRSEVSIPSTRARASPSEDGSMPATPTSASASLCRTLYIRSVPMLPDPRITTRSDIRAALLSEHRYRIHRRARALLDPQRSDEAEELPPPFLLAGGRQVLEAQTVRVVQAHRADADGVDRVGDALALARDRLTVAVPADSGHAAFVQQRHDAGMQAGLSHGRVPPGLLQALASMPGAPAP